MFHDDPQKEMSRDRPTHIRHLQPSDVVTYKRQPAVVHNIFYSKKRRQWLIVIEVRGDMGRRKKEISVNDWQLKVTRAASMH